MEQKEDKTRSIELKYDRNARFYDLLELPIEFLFYGRWRRLAFSRLRKGKVLEVGAGTGKNLPYYTDGFEVLATDISEKMLAKAKRRTVKLNLPVTLKNMDVQKLDLPDNTFDSTLATFVFCSVPDPVTGLQELKRVLKGDGIAVFLDHVRPRGILGPLFDFLNPLIQQLLGVNINRNTVGNIRKAGFEIVEEKNLFLDIYKLIVARSSAD